MTRKSVNGVSCDELFQKAIPLLSYEAESHARDTFYNQIITASGLALYGCGPFDLTVVRAKNGLYETAVYSEENYIPEQEMLALQERFTGHSTENFVCYSIDSENDLAVLTLKQY